MITLCDCIFIFLKIFSFAWSCDGRRCATSCKDGKIRVYDPRASQDPIAVCGNNSFKLQTYNLCYLFGTPLSVNPINYWIVDSVALSLFADHTLFLNP